MSSQSPHSHANINIPHEQRQVDKSDVQRVWQHGVKLLSTTRRYLGCDGEAHVHIMVTVLQYLWLNDWDEAALLANEGVFCQVIRVGGDCQGAGRAGGDLVDCAPFGKARSLLVEPLTPLPQVVQTLRAIRRRVVAAAATVSSE